MNKNLTSLVPFLIPMDPPENADFNLSYIGFIDILVGLET